MGQIGKNWVNYLDRQGLVTQHQGLGGDAGDSCNRSCATALGERYVGKVYIPSLAKFTHPKLPGVLRRHSDRTKWYGDWDRGSRDQTIPYIILLGELRKYRLLSWYMLGHALRAFAFTTNVRRNGVYRDAKEHAAKASRWVKHNPGLKLPDFTGPEFWALEARAMPTLVRWLLFPVLLLGDLETLLGSITRRWVSPQDNDVINHTLVLINGLRRTPTPLLRLAVRITPASFLQPRLDNFFGSEKEPPINKLLAPTVRKYLERP